MLRFSEAHVEVLTFVQDLESSHVPRICLALDHLVASPSEEVIPAIQTRLCDLLAHNSSVCVFASFKSCQADTRPFRPLVRRRALLAYKQLSHYRPDLLVSIVPNVCRRLKDSDGSVSNAALSLVTRTFLVGEFTFFYFGLDLKL